MVPILPISTKRTITSKQWWSTIPPISTNEQSPLNSDGQQFHQYQQNEQSPLNSDGQQFHQYQQTLTWNNLAQKKTHMAGPKKI